MITNEKQAENLQQDLDPVHDPEWIPSRMAPSQMGSIPNGHHPEWAPSRMGTIPNGHHPEWAQSRMGTIPNGHHPEWAPSQMGSYIYIITLVFYSYCLVRSFLQRREFR